MTDRSKRGSIDSFRGPVPGTGCVFRKPIRDEYPPRTAVEDFWGRETPVRAIYLSGGSSVGNCKEMVLTREEQRWRVDNCTEMVLTREEPHWRVDACRGCVFRSVAGRGSGISNTSVRTACLKMVLVRENSREVAGCGLPVTMWVFRNGTRWERIHRRVSSRR